MATTSVMRVLVQRVQLLQFSSTTTFSRGSHVRHLSLYRGSTGFSRFHRWKHISGCSSTASPAPTWKCLRNINSSFRELRIGLTRVRPPMAGKDKSASAGAWTLRRLSSYSSKGSGSGDTTVVYGLVGVRGYCFSVCPCGRVLGRTNCTTILALPSLQYLTQVHVAPCVPMVTTFIRVVIIQA